MRRKRGVWVQRLTRPAQNLLRYRSVNFVRVGGDVGVNLPGPKTEDAGARKKQENKDEDGWGGGGEKKNQKRKKKKKTGERKKF